MHVDSASSPHHEALLRALIVSEVRYVCEGLAEVLARTSIAHVAGFAGDIVGALAALQQSKIDIILLDTAMPNSLSVAYRIHGYAPAVPIVALALDETEDNVIVWAEAGAKAYVPKNAGLVDLLASLEAATRAEQSFSPAVTGGPVRGPACLATSAEQASATPFLTSREKQIIGLMCSGMSNKDIARRLNIQLSTTKSHVHNVLGKLNVQRRGQAVARMLEPATAVPSSRMAAMAEGFR